MITILGHAEDENAEHGKAVYVTARFGGYHPTFGEVATVKTLRVRTGQPEDELLRSEYQRWYALYDAAAEF